MLTGDGSFDSFDCQRTKRSETSSVITVVSLVLLPVGTSIIHVSFAFLVPRVLQLIGRTIAGIILLQADITIDLLAQDA